ALLALVYFGQACDKKADGPGATTSGGASAPGAASATTPAGSEVPQAAPNTAATAPGTSAASLLSVGSEAPNIEAVAHSGEQVKLADYRGKVVIVYFYPKDDTPGCTVEAKGIRDDWSRFKSAEAIVLGVSTDDNESHQAFAKKYDLPFLLLPDPKQEIAAAFKVPVQNGYAKRVTFVIDKQGRVAKVFPEVTPSAHSKELLTVLDELKG
nr:peroxiredoxin [Polyangiaceae bacterium]